MRSYIDSANPQTSPDPDTIPFAMSLPFPQNMKAYSQLNIPNAGEATYTIQAACAFTDLHLDLEHSLLYQLYGSKAWFAFPRTSKNENLYYTMHSNPSDFMFLSGRALREMEGGRCGVSSIGDLVFVPAEWFHFVVTLEPSIWVGSWLKGNGYQMLNSAYMKMKATRVRHLGKNDQSSDEWTQDEEDKVRDAIMILWKELEWQYKTKSLTKEVLEHSVDSVYKFLRFKGSTWLWKLVTSKRWKRLLNDSVISLEGGSNGVWENGCFHGDCMQGTGTSLEEIIKHMKAFHTSE